MMRSHSYSKTVLALLLLVAASALVLSAGSVAGTGAASPQAAVAAAGRPCDQNQKVAVPADCGQADPSNMSTQSSEEKGFGRRTCRCSCGYPCKTSADCGGAPCVAGISCC